ncbi:HNH endonuclease [SAR202 cluster bacterium AC-647-N09_OGT_505m]|nr:HNH endonuclease [SAR202 cluster bacterium AC-647-N09_OGT_505m]
MISAPVLLLNQNYQPLNVCSVRRAVVLLDIGKAELLEYGLGQIHTPSHAIPIPSVIRLMYLIKRPLLQRRLSRKEVFLRDNYSCQYCGRETKQLTLDHVMPRSRDGAHSWENVVSACISCNHRKAGRTPQEAGMHLSGEVRQPRVNPYSLFTHKPLQYGWHKFIPWLSM